MIAAPKASQLTYKERQKLVLPASLVAVVMALLLLLQAIGPQALDPAARQVSALAGLAALAYIAVLYLGALRLLERYPALNWAIVLINGAGLGVLFTDPVIATTMVPYVLSLVVIVVSAILSGRAPTYAFIVLTTLVHSVFEGGAVWSDSLRLLQLVTLPTFGVIATETIITLQATINAQLRRLQLVNNVARNLASSLETHQVVSLLCTAIQNTFSADTYYVGLLEGDHIRMVLLYDDGEFFTDMEVPLEDSLAGWIVRNQRSLLLQDVPKQGPSLGIEIVSIGKPRMSRAWMGAPMETRDRIVGIVAVASYEAAVFDQGDLEALENVAQQAAQAIDNSYHHADVERQSHQDSLTGVYNHGYFLEVAERELAAAAAEGYPVALIMLDIDHFKMYNDHYGHLVGDRALRAMVENIRAHIKKTDAVGRWGGEEFAVLLPRAGVAQALQIAERIRQTTNCCELPNRAGEQISGPTVSQGIAVFPDETSDLMTLVDIADQRLFMAKERGRNQIETVSALPGTFQDLK